MKIKKLIGRELELFRENRRMKVGGLILIALIPLIYSYTFLASLWDPFKNLKNLPVAYVNLDKGTDFGGHRVVLADEVIEELNRRADFKYASLGSEAEARTKVVSGEAYFAILFPEDFSAHALPGFSGEPGVVHIILSEGLGFTSSLIARRMGNELTQHLNEQLNARRWQLVFNESGSAGSSLTRLRDAVDRLAAGAETLARSEGELGHGIAKLNEGVLKLAGGATRLREGTETYKKEVGKIPLFGGKAERGAAQLETGARELESGLQAAAIGQGKIASGQTEASEGARRLHTGLSLLRAHIPKSVHTPPGDAAGLATSVVVVRESLTGGVTYGDAFAPYFLALSLWLGIVILTFFFHFRRLRDEMQRRPQWERCLQKITLPFAVALFQAFLVSIGTRQWLGMQLASPLASLFVCLQASAIFLVIIFSFILIFRDAGRLVSLLFFVFQIASAGGAFPIEMSGKVFRESNPFLPFTNVVKALRAVNLGAYEGHYGVFLLKAWFVAAIIAAIAYFVARWKYVSDREYSLAADF